MGTVLWAKNAYGHSASLMEYDPASSNRTCLTASRIDCENAGSHVTIASGATMTLKMQERGWFRGDREIWTRPSSTVTTISTRPSRTAVFFKSSNVDAETENSTA